MHLAIISLLDKRVTNILSNRIKEFDVSVIAIGPNNKFGRAVRANNPFQKLDLTKDEDEIVLMTSIDHAPFLTVDRRRVIVEGVAPLKNRDGNPITSYRLPLFKAVILRPTEGAQLTNPNITGYQLRRQLFPIFSRPPLSKSE